MAFEWLETAGSNISDPFTAKDVHASQIPTEQGKDALRRTGRAQQQMVAAQGYGLAAGAGGGMASPAAVRAAQMAAARSGSQIGAQTLTAQQQYQQQMQALQAQINMQAQIANAELDQKRDAATIGGAATLLALSDPRAKQDVVDLSFGQPEVVPRPSPARTGVPTLYPNYITKQPEPERQFVADAGPRPGPARYPAGDMSQEVAFRNARNNEFTEWRETPDAFRTERTGTGATPVITAGGHYEATPVRPEREGAGSKADKAASAAGILGAFGGQDAGASLIPRGNYQMLDFGSVGSDPYMKRDKQYVTSGMAAKTDVAPAASAPPPQYGEALSLTDAAAEVPALSFRYKPEYAAQEGVSPEQRMVGTDAAALAQNPAYAHAVRQGPDGMLRMDEGQTTMANVAVSSDLARRVKALESGNPAVARGPQYSEALPPVERAALEDQVIAEASGGARPSEGAVRPAAAGVQPGRGQRQFSGGTTSELGFEPIREAPRDAPIRKKLGSLEQKVLRGMPQDIDLQNYSVRELPANVDVAKGVGQVYHDRETGKRYLVTQRAVREQGTYENLTPSRDSLRDLSYAEGVQHGESALPWQNLTAEERQEFQRNPKGFVPPTWEDYRGDTAGRVGTVDLVPGSEDVKRSIRKPRIREFASTLQGETTGQRFPDASMVHRALQERGVKVKKSEVIDALRVEFDL